MMSKTADQSIYWFCTHMMVSSITMLLPDEEIEHDVTCWMIAAIFQVFCKRNYTLRMLLLKSED
jgi:hypothetical protein